MPDDSNGIYNVPAGTLVNTGDIVLPSQHNPWANDSASAISNRFSKDGRAPATGNWNINNFRLTNVGDPVANGDAINKTYADGITANISASVRGYLFGLTLSNNATDPTNDINISPGAAASDSSAPSTMTLVSSITKRLDAAWAVGTGNGGLDTGTIANITYHVWIIQRSDTGVVDALFSASATNPTMPSGYDRKRRIGSILRESGSIVAFVQRGNRFTRPQSIDRNSTTAVTDSLLSLKVPTSISVQPIFTCAALTGGVAGQATIYVGDGSDAVAPYRVFILGDGANVRNAATLYGGVYTNGSAQIRYSALLATTTFAFNLVETYGWIDTRGQE